MNSDPLISSSSIRASSGGHLLLLDVDAYSLTVCLCVD
jgi:hypothetical protein